MTHSRVVPLIKKTGGDERSTAAGQCLGRRSHHSGLLLLLHGNPSVDHTGSHHGGSKHHLCSSENGSQNHVNQSISGLLLLLQSRHSTVGCNCMEVTVNGGGSGGLSVNSPFGLILRTGVLLQVQLLLGGSAETNLRRHHFVCHRLSGSMIVPRGKKYGSGIGTAWEWE